MSVRYWPASGYHLVFLCLSCPRKDRNAASGPLRDNVAGVSFPPAHRFPPRAPHTASGLARFTIEIQKSRETTVQMLPSQDVAQSGCCPVRMLPSQNVDPSDRRRGPFLFGTFNSVQAVWPKRSRSASVGGITTSNKVTIAVTN